VGIRTTSDLVIGLLKSEYGPHPDPTNIDGPLVYPDLTPCIAAANTLINAVVFIDGTTTSSAGRPPISGDKATLIQLETMMAAHYYQVFDQPFTSTSKGGASGSFQNAAKGTGFGFTKWGQQAMALDYSGILKAIENGAFAGMTWLGKTLSEQLTFQQRMA
jgi:hypothetical protein